MNLAKTPVQNKHKPKKSYYQTQYKKILRIEKSKSKSWRIPHVVFPALSARLGDGYRYSRRWRAIGSWRRRSRRLRQSRGWDRWRGVDDGILAAIVSSPVDCFYQLSEMASICSGGGERRRWHEMARVDGGAAPPPFAFLSLFTLQIGENPAAEEMACVSGG
nr:hypothetical protein Itr_chr01CG06650 [Ipomoea trifida]